MHAFAILMNTRIWGESSMPSRKPSHRPVLRAQDGLGASIACTFIASNSQQREGGGNWTSPGKSFRF